MSAKYWYRRIALCCLLGAVCLSAPALAQNDGSPENSAKTSNRHNGIFIEPPYDTSKYQRYFPEALFMVGADKSESEAYGYMRAAAEKGYAKAQFWMGDYYYKHNVQSKAVYWYKKAAEQNYTKAKIALASMSDQEVAHSNIDENASSDEKLTVSKTKSAGDSQRKATISGSKILTVSKDIYLNTALYDDLKPFDAYTLGAAAVSKGDPKGYALLESSARRGCSHAKLTLANLFLLCDHPLKMKDTYVVVLEDKPLNNKARLQRYLQWMNSAAENGSSTAAKELAELYRKGKHVGKDANQIFKYTKLAALAKEPEYMYRLGTYYAQGLGCQKDRNAAVKWIKQAAHLGSGEASQWLEERRGHYVDSDVAVGSERVNINTEFENCDKRFFLRYQKYKSEGYSDRYAAEQALSRYFDVTVRVANFCLSQGAQSYGAAVCGIVGNAFSDRGKDYVVLAYDGDTLIFRSAAGNCERYIGKAVSVGCSLHKSESVIYRIDDASTSTVYKTVRKWQGPKIKGWEDLL